MRVTMAFDAKGGDVLHMPNWAPGAYNLKEDWKKVANFSVKASKGTISVAQDGNAWTIKGATGPIQVSYELPAVDATGAHWAGPSSYLYVEGRTQEASTLSLDLPKGWTAELGIVPNKKGVYEARSYDVLADNPVSAGPLVTDRFKAAGTDYVIVYRGAPDVVGQVDRPFTISQCKQIAEAQAKFFGGSPNKKYVFHFMVYPAQDGGWGLEHLSSTQIGLATGLGKGTVGVISHEHFHLWNVKRIRSAVLGPFDYTKLPQTGALWWLEGVTEYYAHVFLARDGQHTEADLYGQIMRNYNAVQNNPAHLTISPYASSYRVNEANNGKGNSQGLQISYYQLGLLCGLVLDAELRSTTHGKATLDDVERDLFKQTKDWQPGFPEDGIRKTLVKFGGAHMGEFYDQVVMKPGDLPVPQALEKLGLEIVEKNDTTPILGFMGNVVAGQGVVIDRVIPPNPDLQPKDVVVSIDGKSLTDPSYHKALQNFNLGWKSKLAGDTIKLEVKTGDKVRTISWKLTAPSEPMKTKVIRPKAGASAETVKLREAWLKG